MTINISFRDILTIPAMSHLREMDLLNPENDALALPFLYDMGIDTRFPLHITCNLHRDLNNKVAVGYRYTGYMRRDKAFTKSPFCDMISRVAIAMDRDVSLGMHMAGMLNQTLDFDKMVSEANIDGNEREAEEMEDDTEYVANSVLIRTLEELRDSVRGNNNNNVKEVN